MSRSLALTVALALSVGPTTRAAGAVLSIAVGGATLSAQSFSLAGGWSALTGKPFWAATIS